MSRHGVRVLQLLFPPMALTLSSVTHIGIASIAVLKALPTSSITLQSTSAKPILLTSAPQDSHQCCSTGSTSSRPSSASKLMVYGCCLTEFLRKLQMKCFVQEADAPAVFLTVLPSSWQLLRDCDNCDLSFW